MIFFIMFQHLFAQMLTANGLGRFLLFNLAFGLIWGVYQEIAYRGLVQPVLATYLGPVGGLVATNIVFTFGPLHASIWSRVAADPHAATMFVPIFAIGLVLKSSIGEREIFGCPPSFTASGRSTWSADLMVAPSPHRRKTIASTVLGSAIHQSAQPLQVLEALVKLKSCEPTRWSPYLTT